MTEGDVRKGISAAFEGFLRAYEEWGGYQFHGWTDKTDPRNYRGPAIWSEADCVYRFARELENEFPGMVHLEYKIADWTTAEFDPSEERRQSVDIAIVNMAGFEESGDSERRFKEVIPEAFIEVKVFFKGWWGGAWQMDAIGNVEAVEWDLMSLAELRERKRCKVAAVLVIDDEDFLDRHLTHTAPLDQVSLLVAGPKTLAERGLGGERTEKSLERIDKLVAEEEAKDEKLRLELEARRARAIKLLESSSDIDKAVSALTIRDFEAVLEAAVERSRPDVLTALLRRAHTEEGAKWDERHQRVQDAMDSLPASDI